MTTERTAPGLSEPQGRGEEPLFHFTRIYLSFLQGLFKQFPEGSYHWSDDDVNTEICITDQAPFPRERLDQRPAIVVMRGPAQFSNLSLDNMRTVDLRTGAKERTDLIACTMSISIIAKLGVEAQRIAWIVMRHLRTFKTLLQRQGIHKVGDEVSVSPEGPPGSMVTGEADSEFCMVTVQSPFFFQWTEQTTPADASLFNSVAAHMKFTLVPSLHSEKPRVPRGPTVRGMPVISKTPEVSSNLEVEMRS